MATIIVPMFRLVNLLLPVTCPVCGTEVEGEEFGRMDKKCWSKISFIKKPFCELCSKPLPNSSLESVDGQLCLSCYRKPPPWQAARAVFLFKGAGRGLVLRYKYADRVDCTDFLAQLLYKAAAPLLRDSDLIVPVPLTRLRLFLRRYNQAALLAGRLAELGGKPRSFALATTRRTKDQIRLPKSKRFANMRGAFRLVADVKGKRVLLVDDVRTSGATATYCTKVLLDGGASSVKVATLAWVAL